MRTEIDLNESEIDLNECKHFLKANMALSEIDSNWMASKIDSGLLLKLSVHTRLDRSQIHLDPSQFAFERSHLDRFWLGSTPLRFYCSTFQCGRICFINIWTLWRVGSFCISYISHLLNIFKTLSGCSPFKNDWEISETTDVLSASQNKIRGMRKWN